METLTNLIVSFFDLIEAEGRTLRERAVLVAEGLLVMFLGVSLLICGLFVVGAALYFWLSEHLGRPASALIVAALPVIRRIADPEGTNDILRKRLPVLNEQKELTIEEAKATGQP